MTIYHGSDHKLAKPMFGFGKKDNDYGSGFYATTEYEKAAEWAINHGGEAAYVNRYEIDDADLNIVHLDDFGPLAWITEIIANRGARGEAATLLGDRLISKYKVDLSAADIIIGYRADDSYSDIVDAFLKNQLNLDEVDRLFKKGNLGKQYFVKSEKAFSRLRFTGATEVFAEQCNTNTEYLARTEVSRFLRNRESQILVNGYTPAGITAREAATKTYCYNNQYRYYDECNAQTQDKGGLSR